MPFEFFILNAVISFESCSSRSIGFSSLPCEVLVVLGISPSNILDIFQWSLCVFDQ